MHIYTETELTRVYFQVQLDNIPQYPKTYYLLNCHSTWSVDYPMRMKHITFVMIREVALLTIVLPPCTTSVSTDILYRINLEKSESYHTKWTALAGNSKS